MLSRVIALCSVILALKEYTNFASAGASLSHAHVLVGTVSSNAGAQDVQPFLCIIYVLLHLNMTTAALYGSCTVQVGPEQVYFDILQKKPKATDLSGICNFSSGK